MMARILILFTLIFSQFTSATVSQVHRDLHNAIGEKGIIHFHGAVMVSPCAFSAESREQSVDMKEIPARKFHQAGDRSDQVIFTIRMKDCLAGAHESHEDIPGKVTGTNTRVYTSDERVISLAFMGEQDAANPELLMVHGGTTGLGLRLMDSKGKALVLNQTQHPYLLMPGDNSLTFIASLESTQKNVGSGSFYGMVHLMMEYL